MERWRLTISVLSICVAASALASCATSPSSPASSAAPGRPPERAILDVAGSIGRHAPLRDERIRRRERASTQRKLVGTLAGVERPIGVCSDSSGNVFVTAYYTQDVVEYEHGGTTPIARLPDFGYHPRGCAVIPLADDLAVANTERWTDRAATWQSTPARPANPPTTRRPASIRFRGAPTHDEGDLFANGTQLAELRAGSDSLTAISLSVSGDGLQWDSTNLAMIDAASKALYRISISGPSGTVAGTMRFKGLIFEVGYDFVLTSNKAVVPFASIRDNLTKIRFWKYPQSGQHGRSFKAGERLHLRVGVEPTGRSAPMTSLRYLRGMPRSNIHRGLPGRRHGAANETANGSLLSRRLIFGSRLQ